MSNIIINRSEEWSGSLRKYLIYIDGNKVGSLSNGDKVKLQVSPGSHTLKIMVDWRTASTPTINFNIHETETKEFEVKNNPKITWAIIVLAALAVTYSIINNTLGAPYNAIALTAALLIALFLLYKTWSQILALNEL